MTGLARGLEPLSAEIIWEKQRPALRPGKDASCAVEGLSGSGNTIVLKEEDVILAGSLRLRVGLIA